jgi:hypothetical protein
MQEQPKYNDRNEVMELIFSIMNVAHAEYHICETIQANTDWNLSYLMEYLEGIRSVRIRLMKLLIQQRPAVKGLWCTFKHLFLALFSLYELMEKEKCDPVIIEQASQLNLLLDDMLSHDEFEGLKGCKRCNDESSN